MGISDAMFFNVFILLFVSTIFFSNVHHEKGLGRVKVPLLSDGFTLIVVGSGPVYAQGNQWDTLKVS